MAFTSLEIKLLTQAVILCGVPLALWLLPYVGAILPLVILQIATGIFVGPSVMGQLWPGFESWLFSGAALQGLAALAFWGVTFFIFYTGLHIEKEMFFGPRATVEFWVLALSSVFIPFAVGCLIGWLLVSVFFDSTLLGADGTVVTYILSVGVCVGVTALPVLSAILMEIGQLESDLGILMIACATVHDVLLWLLITLISGLANASDNWAGKWQPLASIGLLVALLLVLGFVYQPTMRCVMRTAWWQNLSAVPRLTITLALMYLTAIGSEVLQVHTLVGVVAFGACVPLPEKPFVMGHVDVLNRALFLPLFFGNAGIKVTLNQANSRTAWVFFALTVGAIVGQIFGSLLVVKLFKRSWKQAILVMMFMLSKGAVGIVVATLLLSGKIIDNDTFSGMMLMSLACTAVTKPAILIIQKYFSEPGENLFQFGPTAPAPSLPETASLPTHDSLHELQKQGFGKPVPIDTADDTPTTDEAPEAAASATERPPNPYLFLTQQATFSRSRPELEVPAQSLAELPDATESEKNC
eukprot:EG_transcript_3147